MVNLRKRAVQTSMAPAKRTSSRAATVETSSTKKYNEINIDSDSDGIELESEDDKDSKEVESTDILNGYISDQSSESSQDISVDSDEDSELMEEEDGSEDDKEIRRIIEKTEAETRNMPLTARQRATLEGGIQDPTVSTTVIDPRNLLTNEQALKNSEKSRRRKLQRDIKIEETKRATIDRLLQKQKKTPAASAANVEDQDKESIAAELDKKESLQPGMIRFISRPTESLLQFPDDATYQSALSEFSQVTPNDRAICQICSKNQSKYTHPVNGKVFCSVSCYKLIK